MFEVIDSVVGAAIALAGIGAGFKIQDMKGRKYKSPQPICGCKHHRSYHLEDGRCNQTNWEGDMCKCTAYYGPKTYDEIIAGDI